MLKKYEDFTGESVVDMYDIANDHIDIVFKGDDKVYRYSSRNMTLPKYYTIMTSLTARNGMVEKYLSSWKDLHD